MKRALLIALLLLAVACATTTPTVDPPLETTATLRVFQEQLECCYIEGQVSYLSIDGTEQEFRPKTTEVSLLVEMEVRVGEIDLESWQRPCSGNCDSLDPPANQCATTVEAGAGQTVRILISFSPGPDPCVLETVEEDPPSYSDAG